MQALGLENTSATRASFLIQVSDFTSILSELALKYACMQKTVYAACALLFPAYALQCLQIVHAWRRSLLLSRQPSPLWPVSGLAA